MKLRTKVNRWLLGAASSLALLVVPAYGVEIVFDDMEHGDPLGNGWFFFSGDVGGGGISPNSIDLPPMDGGLFSLDAGYGSGGVAGFVGGYGRTNPLDLSDMTNFSFWINPDAGQDYILEINLQDDDDGDDFIPEVPDGADDEFQFNCVVSDVGPCAISGGGWQLVTIPISSFFDDNGFHFGGNGIFDPTPVSGGGNGQMINVVMAIISNSGADATHRTDYWTFNDDAVEVSNIIDDFEDGDGSDWIFFDGNLAGGGGGAEMGGAPEGDWFFSTGWGGEGTDSGFYGGYFKNFDNAAQFVPGPDPYFNVWVRNESTTTVDGYTLEITIREDLDGNGWTDGSEDSFRLDTVYTGADFDDEWTLLSAPFDDFVDLFTGGNGTFDGNLDEVVVVVAGVTGVPGTVVEVDFDLFALSTGGPLQLMTVGDCPGPVTLDYVGGPANSSVGLIFSSSPGSDTLGAGPCVGTPTGLSSPQLFTIVPTDASGGFSLERTAPAGVCGAFLQIVDAAGGCLLSNVTQLP